MPTEARMPEHTQEKFVLVIVSCEDMNGHERLEIIGLFESEKAAETAKPPFTRATRRQVVKILNSPLKKEYY